MKKIMYALVAVMLFSAVPVYANCGMCPLDKGSMSTEDRVAKKMEKMTEKLGLSDEQAVKIKVLITEKMEMKKAIKAQMHEQMKMLTEEFSGQIKAILTDEQKVKFEEMRKEHKGSEKGSGHEHKGSGHEKKGSGDDAKGSNKGS